MSYKHRDKKSGDPLQISDWNTASEEIVRLEQAKVDRKGDAITGSLTIANKVGIGTKNPQAKLDVKGQLKLKNAGKNALHVEGTGSQEQLASFRSDSSDVSIEVRSDGATPMEVYYEITHGGTEEIRKSWKMGTNDNTKLHFSYGNQGSMNGQEKVTIDEQGDFQISGKLGIGTNPRIALAIGDGDTGLDQQGDGNLVIYTNNCKRMQFEGDNIYLNGGVGRVKLHVNGRFVELKHYNNDGNDNGVAICPDRHNHGSLGTNSQAWDDGFITEFWGNRQGSVSDARLKEDVIDIDSVLDNVMQMRAVYYKWKDSAKYKDGTKTAEIGVIAQEIEKFYPELLMTSDDGYKHMQYARLSPILLEAIKELKQKTDDENRQLKAELVAMSVRLTDLESSQ